jgi:acetate kinase
MGLTPLEGLVMGTRSGDIDPSAVTYLAGVLDVDAEEIVRRLNRESGLLGVSGVSNDMREVRAAAASGDPAATLALALFAYRLAKHVAGLVVALGSLDALAFTGGIGEHSAETRADVVALLGFLGLALDEEANAQDGRATRGRISPDGAAPAVLVVPTDEELLIARDTAALLP